MCFYVQTNWIKSREWDWDDDSLISQTGYFYFMKLINYDNNLYYNRSVFALSSARHVIVLWAPLLKSVKKCQAHGSNPGYWDINTNIYTTKLTDTFVHWWPNLIYIYEGRKPLLLRLPLRVGPTSVLWVSFLNGIHHAIWKKLRFATIMVFLYCKLL